MKRIIFKKREEKNSNKSLMNLLKNKSIKSFDKIQLNLIKGGDGGDLGEEDIIPDIKR